MNWLNKLLEDKADVNTSLLMDSKIQLSIAISLKRIADKLELSQKQPIMMTAEEAKLMINGYKV